ncbi:MAG: patatin-like phospholipase family protein [Bacteriovoracaceae bacterium]
MQQSLHYIRAVISFVLLCSIALLAADSNMVRRPKIGIVLSGGGALGFAHIGALRVIDSLGIPVDYIAGTSFGGLLSGLYSIGYRSDSMQSVIEEIDWTELFNDTPKRDILPYAEKKYTGRYHVRLPLKGFTPTPPTGAIAGQKISLLFNKLTYNYSDVIDFDSLPIPFRCVGVDLITGQEVVINRGPLARAMRATMAIPSAFTPVEYGDSLLTDGGLLNNYPVDVLKAMGAEIIIGVDVSGYKFSRNDAKELFKVLDRVASIPRYQKIAEFIKRTDIYIEPQLAGFGVMDFNKETIQQITERGYLAALTQLGKLTELKKRITSSSPTTDSSTQTPLLRHQHPEAFIVHGIRIEGNDKLEFPFIYSLLGISVGSACSREIIERQINDLYALGYFETITYDVRQLDNGEADIVITMKEKSFRELNIGLRYDDFYQLVALVGVRSTNTLISGARFESEMEFAGLFRIWSKLSYPSRSLDQPIYPFITARYKDLPLKFSQPAFTLSYKDRAVTFGVGVGFKVQKSWSVELELDDEATNVLPLTITGGPKLNHHLRYGLLNINLDYIDDILLPKSGIAVLSRLEYSSTVLGSDFNYTQFMVDGKYYFTPIPLHTFLIRSMFLRTYDNIPLYKQFVFGGPHDFAGAEYQGIFGTKFLVGRGEYRYQHKRDIFLKVVVNSFIDPDIFNPVRPSLLKPKFGFGLGVMFTSILGPIDIMFTHGEGEYRAGKAKEIYFHFSAGMKF